MRELQEQIGPMMRQMFESYMENQRLKQATEASRKTIGARERLTFGQGAVARESLVERIGAVSPNVKEDLQ